MSKFRGWLGPISTAQWLFALTLTLGIQAISGGVDISQISGALAVVFINWFNTTVPWKLHE